MSDDAIEMPVDPEQAAKDLAERRALFRLLCKYLDELPKPDQRPSLELVRAGEMYERYA